MVKVPVWLPVSLRVILTVAVEGAVILGVTEPVALELPVSEGVKEGEYVTLVVSLRL